ncbi:phage/plasmid primase, P4 family [Mesorhizobium sp. L103C131B0]|uniref:phage/plasmid primase, P4 family n=1 Tax=Mesorhizobium sp. L103C131B0 TaxID=1287089 RepID=UPI0003D05D8A|nr:phage/plasmid primase, P4 family [Mesorhizobium sp. L103C131B0]ESZ65712.1 hypothetical protein X729_02050 [Mesorhizobium sp. L103C131B0]
MTSDKQRTAADLRPVVEELSLLPRLEYDLARVSAAKKIGIPVGALDKAVISAKAERRAAEVGAGVGLGGEGDLLASDEDTRPPAFSDEALALSFAAEHRDRYRYVAAWGKWMLFDGRCWKAEKTREAFDRARETCRRAAASCDDAQLGKVLASAKTVAAVERLAQSDRRLAATSDQWDADPWLLNTPGGVVNLRTGAMRKHRADDYMTKITAVAPSNDMDFPIFRAFLARTTHDDVGLQNFLKRFSGYALTGVTIEHALAFFHGTGNNGKSVFLSVAAGILGDYHTTAPFETFAASRHEKHPTDVAGLRGARLVTTAETEEGRQWDETKLKQLTGGDLISARFMRQDFFEFAPQFKLIIAGNHKPSLKTVDEAIRRRLHLVPFTVTIPKTERDPDLKEKLKAEWPAILDWLIEGCLDWQEEGLKPPQAVVAASEAYLAEEDTFGRWMADRCELDPNDWTSSADLFGDYDAYARQGREHVGNRTDFTEKLLAQKVIVAERTNAGRGYRGVKLRRTPRATDDVAEKLEEAKKLAAVKRAKAIPRGKMQ